MRSRLPSASRSTSRCLIESLEKRQLLASTPIISEFLAWNDNGLADEDGQHSDWIEIHNPTASDINLDGYYLTDNPSILTKWQFPATPLPAGGYQLVFASNKDRALSGKQLHANFNLNRDGGYLALVLPDRKTIVSQYSPEYPEQLRDISYGLAIDTQRTTLLGPDASVKALVPNDPSTPSTWTTTTFNDSAWTPGYTGVGFEPPAGLPNEIEPNNSLPTANFAADNFATHSGNLYHLGLKGSFGTSEDWFQIGTLQVGDIITITASGAASFRGSAPSLVNPAFELWRGNASANSLVASDLDSGPGQRDALSYRYPITDTDTYYVHSVNPGGQSGQNGYDIAIWLEDNGAPPTTGGSFVYENEGAGNNSLSSSNDASTSWRPVRFLAQTRGSITASDTDLFQYQLTAGDLLSVQIKSLSTLNAKLALLDSTGKTIALEDGTSSATSLPIGDSSFYSFVVPTSATYYLQVQSADNSIGDYKATLYLSTATPPVVTNPYAALIRTNLASQMQSNTSAFIRIPFTVDDPTDFEMLKLHIKYDDGFVAYLNGHEVARRNFDGDPVWNSAANAPHPNSLALVYDDINIPTTWLTAGNNILAIHALNAASDPQDLLIYPELEGFSTLTTVERYFATPTPAYANNISSILGVVADTKFSRDRGFYDSAFTVTIVCDTPGAQIRYTTDGSTPTATSGKIYTTPVTITTTTTLRACAFKPGYLSPAVDTQTYIFLNNVIRQSATPPAGFPTSGIHWDYGMNQTVVTNYSTTIVNDLKSIPSLSLVGNVEDIFGLANGIYSHPDGTGVAWERAASAELIYPDGSDGFQINAGLRIYGGVNRSTSFPKHTFRLLFKDQYGPGKLNYPLFQNALFGNTAVDEFDNIVLRGEFNNSWPFWVDSERTRGQYIQDRFIADTQLAMGQPSPHGMFVHLYVNGLYWGLYSPTERPDASFQAEYLGGEKEQYDALNSSEPIDGDKTAWTTLQNLAAAGVTTLDAYNNIKQYLDVDNLIDYMIINIFGGNQDWDDHNWYAGRKREPGAGFKFFSWDAERTLEDINADRTEINQSDKPSFLYAKLRANPEFKLAFADRIQKYFFNNGALTPAACIDRYTKLAAMVDRAVVGESARWGDFQRAANPYTRNVEWVKQRDWELKTYFPARSNVVLNQFKTDSLYPSLAAPAYNQFGGAITAGFNLKISAASGSIYYTLDGSDPRLPGGALSPTALLWTPNSQLPLSRTTTVKARAKNATTWSALNNATFFYDMSALRITELMYHPADPPQPSPYESEDFEFIELQNTGPNDLDLSGVHFSTTVGFTFNDTTLGENKILAPGQRIVVAKNITAFQSRYGSSIRLVGPYTLPLSDKGARITLDGPANEVILDFAYKDDWYPITDGDGYSLVAINPHAPQPAFSSESNWRPSNLPNGLPGDPDLGINPGSVVINEVLSHTDSSIGDWIELYNTTNTPIDLSGWYLSDDAADLRKYQIQPNTTILPKGFLVFNHLRHFGNPSAPGTKIPFALNEYGERIYLTNTDGSGNVAGYRESVDFGAAQKETTFGRIAHSSDQTDFTALSIPSFNALNDTAFAAPVVINELLYNSVAGTDEFIELKNLTASPLSLADWQFSSAISFTFPADAQILPFAYALVVPITPADYRAKYSIPESVPIFGPYSDSLNNGGDDVHLSRPGTPDPGQPIPYILVDKVKYDNAPPWPLFPDDGFSITRRNPLAYGSDAGNWSPGSFAGSPGLPNGPESPLIDLGPDASIAQDATFSRTTSFGDPDLLQTFSATVNFGDNSPTSPLTLNPDKSFWLIHQYPTPGTYLITVTITDSQDASSSAHLTLSVLPATITGSSSPDNFTLRLDPSGIYLQVFQNLPTSAAPTYSLRHSLLNTLTINSPGPDTLTIDLTYANPLPTNGLTYIASSDSNTLRFINTTTADSLSLTDTQALLNNIPLTYSNTDLQLDCPGGGGINFAAITLTASAKLALTPGHDKILRTSSLTLSPTSTLDLADNALNVLATSDTRDAVLTQIGSWIRSARLIASNASDYIALAAVLNDSPATSLIDPTLDPNCIIVKLTYAGDANLDGLINADDYFLIDSAYITQKGGYYNGDFNYDGVINADDYFLIDSAFIGQSGPLTASKLDSAVSADVVVQQKSRKAEPDGILSQLFSTEPLL